MIQAPLPDSLRYDVRLLAGVARGARVSRPLQSAAAADLLAELRQRQGIAEGPSSKAHSRDLVAAAVSSAGRIGIDIEYRDPGRPIEKIAQHLMRAEVAGADAAYRVFTFWEAYFKATGDFPERVLLRAVAASPLEIQDVGGVRLLHHMVETDFALSLVWDQL